MKTRKKNMFLAVLLTGAMAILATQEAMASTAPCTQVSNQATLSYNVGGAAQPGITSTLGAANQFYVGVKVIVTVTQQDGANKTVTPGNTPAVLKFVVKNDGNAVQDYALAFEAAANGVASPFGGGNDSFNGTTVNVYVDSNGNGVYDAGVDTATTIDNLAADGGTKTVFIVYTPTDLTASNGSIAVYYLKATTEWADGSAIGAQGTQTPTLAQAGGQCNGAKTIDVVFGDQSGPATGDAARDAKHSDASAYIVANATISVTKTFAVVSDPINLAEDGTHNASTWTACAAACPKAIPNAVVRYRIAIANTGGASATLTSITDNLENTIKIVSTANAAHWAVPASTRAAATKSGNLTADSNAADGLSHSNPAAVGGTLTAAIDTILAADAANGYTAGELKSGETLYLTFDVDLQ